MNLRIIVDENIENGAEAFGSIGEATFYHGREITKEKVKEADALIIRSITKVNSELLAGSKVKFVGTATIGTDHVDIPRLQQAGIGFASAKGCNSDAVAEYVFTVLFEFAATQKRDIGGKRIGIVGCGNIGSRVERIARAFGFEVAVNDPPLGRAGLRSDLCSLDYALNSDIVTFHTPLNRGGVDNTFHLLNRGNIDVLKEGAVLINASRGEVVESGALLKAVEIKAVMPILDVWEGEPQFSTEVMEKTFFASPHVAGYSLEGKLNGTSMVYDAMCDFFGLEKKWHPDLPAVLENRIEYNPSGSFEEKVANVLRAVYNPGSDTADMKRISALNPEEKGKGFDLLRKNYKLRREFNNFVIAGEIDDPLIQAGFKALRFGFKG